MKITDVKIFTVAELRIRAYATITLDDSFVIRDIKIVDSPSGLFVSMPNKKVKNGKFHDVAHPKNKQTRDYVESAVLEAYRQELIGQQEGHKVSSPKDDTSKES